MNIASKLKNLHSQPDFIPATIEEIKKIGWQEIDIIIISGDAYVDHPSFGVAVIGRLLIASGYRVAIISQPDWKNENSLKIFGKPQIAFAISSGNIDSYLKNYSAARRFRKSDEYSENAKTGLCPPNAVVKYCNLARKAYPGVKIIIGGIEASMRRAAYYDYWHDKIRPSILVESKADFLIYGMAERTILELIEKINSPKEFSSLRGIARLLGAKESENVTSNEYRNLPSFEEVLKNPAKLMEEIKIIEEESNPFNARPLLQKNNNRILLINPPQIPLSTPELDLIYNLPFAYSPHPKYKAKIPAFEMIKHSITAVRGCPGGCSFCSLALHQGKFLQSRSIESVICEIRKISKKDFFKGTISDIGGPSANCYSLSQSLSLSCKKCRRVSCLFPTICTEFKINDTFFAKLLKTAKEEPNVKNVFVSSGLRTDIALRQKNTTKQIIREHVSGHLKIAPEHLDDEVLKLMRKNKSEDFFKFLKLFMEETKAIGKEQYIVPYFIANFPGSGEEEFSKIKDFLQKSKWRLQQVQDFIPLPMTLASVIYYLEKDINGNPIKVNKGLRERRKQIYALKGRNFSH